jgi:zinc transport system ATP-binding protein
MPPSPVVKVEHLTVHQGGHVAVHDVSFELMPGSSTAIVGPNGAGKSTLVQAMLDLLPWTAGTVEIFGRPPDRLGQLQRQIGYMPQNFMFDRSFPVSVSEVVGLAWISPYKGRFRFPWEPPQDRLSAIAHALHRVDAYHLRQRSIGTLNGDELKRILLAYCLVIPRQLLVLDDAFADVKVKAADEFYQLVDHLKQEEGWTILQISQDLDMVSRHCDQVLCLNRSLISGGEPAVTLTQQNLLSTYGLAFSRYQPRGEGDLNFS